MFKKVVYCIFFIVSIIFNIISEDIFFYAKEDGNVYKGNKDVIGTLKKGELDGPFIRHLKAGERLELIEWGQSETIGDAKGTWVKVKTTQGEVGWCFDAYLKEVK